MEEKILKQFQQARVFILNFIQEEVSDAILSKFVFNPWPVASSTMHPVKLSWYLNDLLVKEIDSGSINFLFVYVPLVENSIQNTLSDF